MIARITHLYIKPENLSEIKSVFENEVAAAVKNKTGFKSSYLLIDSQRGHCITIGMWDKETGMEEDENSGRFQKRVDAIQKYCVAPVKREIYEVASIILPDTGDFGIIKGSQF